MELEALAGVLEGSEDWQADVGPIRSRQLRILSLVASRYLSAGELPRVCHDACVCRCIRIQLTRRASALFLLP